MRLTSKLLSYLNRVFSKDPERFLALRLLYDGQMEWRIEDSVLTTVVSDGSGIDLTVDLRGHSLNSLATYLEAQPGYSVVQVETSDLSARALMDGVGDTESSNGDHLYAYSSMLWAYMEANASELTTAKQQVVEMLEQMSTKTADDEWLDELGSYYAVPRYPGETDASYGPRIIAGVLRPRGNNIAIASALEEISAGLRARIIDAAVIPTSENIRDGSILYDGTYLRYPGIASFEYGLFDAEFDVDLISGPAFDGQLIADFIDHFRDAGTHLRKISVFGHLNETSDFPAWQEFVSITATQDARGVVGTVETSAPAASATGAVNVSALGVSANSSAPAATASETSPGTGSGVISTALVSAPQASVHIGTRGSGAVATVTTSAPSGSVDVIPTETLNIDLGAFEETYVSQERSHDGSITRDGTAVYDTGGDEFTVSVQS